MVLFLGRTSNEVFVVLVVHSFYSSFCCCFVLFIIHFFLCDVILHSLLFNVIPHSSVDYRQVFSTPILYFQPSPLQSDSQHFHFNLFEIFFHSFYRERYGFEWAFFTLRSFTNILPAFIKASLGAGSSSLKFAGLHADPRNTD